MKEVDFLIVGQGIAGSILAQQLLDLDKKVHIIDSSSGYTSSRQATGIINPITGRRFVKSWMIDTLLPYAENYYFHLQQKYATSFLKKTTQIKVLQKIEQVNDFYSRMQEDEYKPYLSLYNKDMEGVIKQYRFIRISPLLQIDVNRLQDCFLNEFKQINCIEHEEFIHDKCFISKDSVSYKNIVAKHIIFAEGYLLRENPYFSFLPIQFSKGEALVIHCPTLSLNDVLHSYATLSPLGKERFYAGATYDWNDDKQVPTQAKHKNLKQRIEKTIHLPFTIENHKVGIRPTTKDRRPFLGTHPTHKNVHVFNGLGTKGLSLAPYFANALIEHILYKKPLLNEVSIHRFYEK